MKALFNLNLFVLLLSCSTGQYALKQNELLPYKEFSQITKNVEELKPFKLNLIQDKRDRLAVGKAYTGVKYNETPVTLTVPVKDYVQSFLVAAFEMRNIPTDSTADLTMQVEINHIWVEEVIEKFKPELAKCKVDFSFYIGGENKKWAGNFWTELTSAGDLSDGTERLAPTLASCMNNLVEKLVSDQKFINILK